MIMIERMYLMMVRSHNLWLIVLIYQFRKIYCKKKKSHDQSLNVVGWINFDFNVTIQKYSFFLIHIFIYLDKDFVNGCDLLIACEILQKQIQFIDKEKKNIIIPSISMNRQISFNSNQSYSGEKDFIFN